MFHMPFDALRHNTAPLQYTDGGYVLRRPRTQPARLVVTLRGSRRFNFSFQLSAVFGSSTSAMKPHSALLIAACTLLSKSFSAQVIYDFEDGDIAYWGIEGDGSLALETANGNPGNALRVNEPAAGLRNFVIAHPGMSGDWSVATTSDSIFFDLYAHEISGSVGAGVGYLIELRSSTSSAQALIDWVPQFDVWQGVAVPTDPAVWTIVTGTWSDLLLNVETVRIRAEFIDGDEYVLFDNIGLSFVPIIQVQDDLVCSSFEPGEGLDGWNFQNTGSIIVNTTDGNPPNAIQLADQSGDLSMAYAPPKFRGDLSTWNGVGTLSFDVRVNTNLTAVLPPAPHVRLAGPGGEASVAATAPEVLQATNQWHTFNYALDATTWTMTSGTWNDLLANVTTIEITLEYYTGTAETVLMDNFCMGLLNTGLSDVGTIPTMRLIPNPSTVSTRLSLPSKGVKQVSIHALNGELLSMRSTVADFMDLHVAQLANGAYIIRVVDEIGAHSLPLLVQH